MAESWLATVDVESAPIPQEEYMLARRNLILHAAFVTIALVAVACGTTAAPTPQTIVVTSPPLIQTVVVTSPPQAAPTTAPVPTATAKPVPTGPGTKTINVAAAWGGGER